MNPNPDEIQFEGPTQGPLMEGVGTLNPPKPSNPPIPSVPYFPPDDPILVMASKPPEPRKVVISLDNDPEEVVSLDLEGCNLFFEDGVGRFLDLEEAILQQLSKENRERFLVSAGANARQVRHQANPDLVQTPGMTITPGKAPLEKRRNTATAKFHIEGQKPGTRYAWPLASEIQEFEEMGYHVSTDPNLKTYGGDVGTTRRVLRNGEVEHVLMEAPIETFNQKIKEDSDVSKKRMKGIEEATKQDIRASGGLPLDAATAAKAPWGVITPPG